MASMDVAQARWNEVDAILQAWLEERKELIAVYNTLHEKVEQRDGPESSTQELSAFCQILVDYVSAGHFEVYEKLISEAQDFEDQDSIKLAQSLYPEIDKTTDVAEEFNDRYAFPEDVTSLKLDVAALGDVLAERFALEDQLIEKIHTAHQLEAAEA